MVWYKSNVVDVGTLAQNIMSTASGSLVHITDGADNIPVKSLVSQIVAVESGNGQPKSPSNPYTISGFANGIVSVCGINVWDEVWELGTLNTSTGGDSSATTRIRSKNYIPVKPNTTYTYRQGTASGQTTGRACYYDANQTFISSTSYFPSETETFNGVATFTTPNNAYYMRFSPASGYGTTYNNDISINYPSSDTSYHAYNGNTYTFAFGQTVYGGHFDNKGNLVVTHGYIASYNGETINEPWVSSMDNYVPNTSPSTGAQVVYPLTSPITLAITSQDIPTRLGENNIFSNCGDVEVNYYNANANVIADLIRSL